MKNLSEKSQRISKLAFCNNPEIRTPHSQPLFIHSVPVVPVPAQQVVLSSRRLVHCSNHSFFSQQERRKHFSKHLTRSQFNL